MSETPRRKRLTVADVALAFDVPVESLDGVEQERQRKRDTRAAMLRQLREHLRLARERLTEQLLQARSSGAAQ